MAYKDDAVQAKLSSLNDTQESIVTVAQWIMFHRRHAEKTAQIWKQRLESSNASKKLTLVYLANEVVQQSKARQKDEFVKAFAPIIADAITAAYKGMPNDLQQKLRRVTEVWRTRQIFEARLLNEIEARIAELDLNRTTGRKPQLGGSLFSSNANSAPPELQPLIPLAANLVKAEIAASSASRNANNDYDKLTDPSAPALKLPVHAARLSAVLKSLSTAEGAVAESIKARKILIEGIQVLVKNNLEAVAKEEQEVASLNQRKTEMESKKREVEDAIMRGLADEPTEEPARPEIEGLTPPPVESLTPDGTPPPMPTYATTTGTVVIDEQQPMHDEPPLMNSHSADRPLLPSALETAESTNAAIPARTRSGDETNGHDPRPVTKKRKISTAEEVNFLGDGETGIDADVAEMLGRD